MKITKFLSLIFSILAIAFAGFSYFGFNRKAGDLEYALQNECKLYAGLFLALAVVAIIVTLIKRDKAIVVPLLGFVTTGIYFVRNVFGDIEFHQTVLEIITPTENTSVLTILLFVTFVAFAFVSVVVKADWAKWYVIGYFVLLLLSTLKFLPSIAFDDHKVPYALLSYSMISGYVAFIAYLFPVPNKEKEPATEPVEAKKEVTE